MLLYKEKQISLWLNDQAIMSWLYLLCADYLQVYRDILVTGCNAQPIIMIFNKIVIYPVTSQKIRLTFN